MTERDRVILAYCSSPIGRHASAWRLPDADVPNPLDPVFLADTARLAEKGVFDYYFLGDVLTSTPALERSWTTGVFNAHPLTLNAYLAGQTSRIGLVSTVNTSYTAPYEVLRAAATLDHLSRGRAGINLVLGAEGVDAPAKNFGLASHPDRAERYGRAFDYVRILDALQTSWDRDWYVGDKAAGRLFNEAAHHPAEYEGEYLSVSGALNVPPPPAGRIPIVHAGASEESLEFGAQYADVRFAPYFEDGWNRDYYRDVKDRLAKHGRSTKEHAVVAGITAYVGETTAEARRIFREAQALVVPEYSAAALAKVLKPQLSSIEVVKNPFRVDPSQPEDIGIADIDPDEKVRDAIDVAAIDAPWLVSAFDAFGEDLTLRDLFHYVSNSGHMNQNSVVGDAKHVAEWIAERFKGEAFDGVKFFPPYNRGQLHALVDLVVPELQRIGIHRREYDTDTLRGHLGLPVEANPGGPR